MSNVHFRAVNYTADVTLKEFAQQRLGKLTTFYNQIIEMHCFTKVFAFFFKVEFTECLFS